MCEFNVLVRIVGVQFHFQKKISFDVKVTIEAVSLFKKMTVPGMMENNTATTTSSASLSLVSSLSSSRWIVGLRL